jgi:hypothetical protein
MTATTSVPASWSTDHPSHHGDVLIDEFMAAAHFSERHARRTAAPAPALLTAAEELTWADVPVMTLLMRVRSVGRMPRDRTQRIFGGMSAIGFTVLGRTDDELVLAAVGRPWRPGGGRGPRLADQADPVDFFVGFGDAGWAKMVANFRVADGALSTETRVLLTDDRSRRGFRRYWLLIRPFSGLIRRRWLAAIVRRAGHA